MTDVAELDTPCLVVDLDVLERNVAGMARAVASAGVRLRPHIKTHKTPEIARWQVDAGTAGLTVAKLSEAEVLADHGFRDLFIANEVVGRAKIDRLVALMRRAAVRTCVDGMDAAAELACAMERAELTLDVLIDVNTGLDRTGVDPETAVDLGLRVDALRGLRVAGVFSYAGSGPMDDDDAERRRLAEREATTAAAIAAELRGRGVGAVDVSVAGTPFARYALGVPGVTEVRPGTYVFGDANYVRRGICERSECALRVRARVISRPAPSRAVIDAGSKVLTTERAAARGADAGYGPIVGLPRSHVVRLWEEHATIELDEDGRQLRVGDAIEIVPHHACTTVNLADRWYGVRGDRVERAFAIAARGSMG